MSYFFHVLILFCIYSIAALSLNLIVGYCGLFTLAHASFFAIGAYTYSLLTLTGWGFFSAIFGAALAGGGLSAMISLPAWRFRGDNFVLMTLAAQALIFSLLHNWYQPDSPPGTMSNLTNGPFGIAGIPKPDILGYQFDTPGSFFVLSLFLLLVSCLWFFILQRSPWGRLLLCMRDDEIALKGLGKDVRLAKLQAFAISCGWVSLAGGLYVSYISFIDASSASLEESILMFCMLLVGGTANLRGPLVGAFLLLLIPELLRLVHFPQAIAGGARMLAYGLLLVLMAHFRPQGMAGGSKLE